MSTILWRRSDGGGDSYTGAKDHPIFLSLKLESTVLSISGCSSIYNKPNSSSGMDTQTPQLSDAEIASFKSSGFLIRRQLLGAAGCAAVCDALWAANTSRVLRRDDPGSWVGPLPDFDLPPPDGGAFDRYSPGTWDDFRSAYG